MKRFTPIAVFLTGWLLLSGCGTVGNDFDLDLARSIVNGQTTQKDVADMFGPPFKTGVQNGHPIWIYEKNKYKAMGNDESKNLIVEFDESGVVRSHQIMSNVPRS